ncbi:MAG: FAD-dependent oxidoreductase [Gammaproteobacteria bacterium]|nr:FAD-dependent oxidoreductase [Gammaproteobacteria bacterium]
MTGCRYDIVVIGGGIHGVGITQAAAAAGYSVLLLEKSALAAGTSSKSSKLIHGGLRYLETYQFGLVAESLRERALLLKLAPGLVKLRPFIIPVYKKTRRAPWLVRLGLSLYAVLGRFREGASFHTIPSSDWQSLDGLRTDDLKAVFSYSDAQTDDRLLTRAVMNSALELGAQYEMPAEFVGAQLDEAGNIVRYRVDHTEKQCVAGILINTAGPWVNEVLARVTPAQVAPAISLVQGSHIVIGQQFKRGIYYVESPRDGRAVFVMPRQNDTLVGTTEIRFRGHPDTVTTFPRERSYLCSVVEYYFPALRGTIANSIIGAFAGLRVLPEGKGHAFHRPRETILRSDNETHPHILSVYGGKLTGYRATAEKVINHLRPFLPERSAIASTRELPLTPPRDDV